MNTNKNYNQSMIVTHKELNPKHFSATKPKKGRDKKLRAYLLHNKKTGYFESPELHAFFGISKYEQGNTGKYSYSLSLSARTRDESKQEEVNQWFKKMQDLDRFMINFGQNYSREIFGKNYSKDDIKIVEALYNSCVRASVNKETGEEYPLKISPKIPSKYSVNENEAGNPDVLLFKKGSKKPLNVKSWDHLQELVPKRSHVTAILQPRLWFINNKFGTSLRVVQLMVEDTKKQGRPTTYAFSAPASDIDKVKQLDDSEDDASSVDEDVEDVEDEEEEDEEEEDDDVDEVVEEKDSDEEEISVNAQ